MRMVVSAGLEVSSTPHGQLCERRSRRLLFVLGLFVLVGLLVLLGLFSAVAGFAQLLFEISNSLDQLSRPQFGILVFFEFVLVLPEFFNFGSCFGQFGLQFGTLLFGELCRVFGLCRRLRISRNSGNFSSVALASLCRAMKSRALLLSRAPRATPDMVLVLRKIPASA